jgi:hypothetical protein
MLTNSETNERHFAMDCRVKPGNDDVKYRPRGARRVRAQCRQQKLHEFFASK